MSEKAAILIAKTLVGFYRIVKPVKDWALLVVFGQVSRCKHQPSCSRYLLEQTKKEGWVGLAKGLERILQCW